DVHAGEHGHPAIGGGVASGRSGGQERECVAGGHGGDSGEDGRRRFPRRNRGNGASERSDSIGVTIEASGGIPEGFRRLGRGAPAGEVGKDFQRDEPTRERPGSSERGGGN